MSAFKTVPGCPLCDGPGGRIVFEAPRFRIVHAQEAGFPAFYRLVWREHAAEFSELSRDDRLLCIEAVAVVEQCLRDHLAPTKVNLAALGNMVPHLHWHVIARFDWDSHFPGAVWAAAQRERAHEREAAVEAQLPAMEQAMAVHLGAM
jgi:diadenosine tetraphosphate (Ap4A) HIT family hydrolase